MEEVVLDCSSVEVCLNYKEDRLESRVSQELDQLLPSSSRPEEQNRLELLLALARWFPQKH